MEQDIVKAYIEHQCKDCDNRTTDLCHIVVINEGGVKRARCVWYENTKIVRRRRKLCEDGQNKPQKNT